MKDFLQDLVAHTHALGFIPLVKISASSTATEISAMADDRSVIVGGKSIKPVPEFDGVFGMPNLNKLDIHLKCPEYKENSKISLTTTEKNGETVPSGLHFENEKGDFQNDYRFMSAEIINEKVKSVKFKGATWEIDFQPSVAAIQRLKFQQNAHSEETVFQVSVKNNNLVFSFGDSSTHAGSFIFQHDVEGSLSKEWSWPVTQVISILSLPGEVSMKISDSGAMQITVDSGITEYNYILPAQTK